MYGLLVPVGGGDPIPLRKEEMIVGRKDNCDIVLRFSNVSGKHCKLVLSSGYWYVVDMKSTNGVKINGAKVSDHRIDPGATLAIAKHLFKLQYDPAKNGATGAPPPEIYQSSDIMSRSLLEKAGLERRPQVRKEEPGSTEPDIPIVVVEKPAIPIPTEKREFFSQLKFD